MAYRSCRNFVQSFAIYWDTDYNGAGDWWHDYGIVILNSGIWRTGSDSYMYIYAGSAAPVRSFDALGYGVSSYDGTGSGVLRRAGRYMNEYTSKQFIDKKISGSYRLCSGDSGGPAVASETKFDSPFYNRVLLGTFCSHRGTHNVCSKKGDNEYWNRTSHRIHKIQQWLGKNCAYTKLRDTAGVNRAAYRCWDPNPSRSVTFTNYPTWVSVSDPLFQNSPFAPSISRAVPIR